MKTVHLYTYLTISGRVQDGAGGYILTVANDGVPDDAKAIKEIFPIKNTPRHRATLYILTEAVRRITEPVSLHIWTDTPLIIAAITGGWIERWKETGYLTSDGTPVKHADMWNALDVCFSGVGMKPEKTIWHLKEEHPYRQYLEWECRKIAENEKIKGERS